MFICFEVPIFLSTNAPVAEKLTESFVSRPTEVRPEVFRVALVDASYILLDAVIPLLIVSVF